MHVSVAYQNTPLRVVTTSEDYNCITSSPLPVLSSTITTAGPLGNDAKSWARARNSANQVFRFFWAWINGRIRPNLRRMIRVATSIASALSIRCQLFVGKLVTPSSGSVRSPV